MIRRSLCRLPSGRFAVGANEALRRLRGSSAGGAPVVPSRRAAPGRLHSRETDGGDTLHGEAAFDSADRNAQAAFERATGPRAQRNPLSGHARDSSVANTLSGEEYRSRLARAAAARGSDDAYRVVDGLDAVEETTNQRRPDASRRDPDDTVDNYIPVASRAHGAEALAPATATRRPRLSVAERIEAKAAAQGRSILRVVMDGENAIDPGTEELKGGPNTSLRSHEVGGAAESGERGHPDTADFESVVERGAAISGKSALFRSIIAPLPLQSREGKTTWDAMREPSAGVQAEVEARSSEDELIRSDGHVTDRFERPTLEHMKEAVQYSTSIYTKKSLVVDGLVGYHDFLTRHEEKTAMVELTRLLKLPGAAQFEPEEGRYCVNLFEKDLGVPTANAPVVFDMHEHAPTLCKVLARAADLRLIPSMPNALQISEFVTPFSGYKPHRKHPSIGPYVGVLSLVSDSLMVLQHVDQPWTPQVDVVRRSMYVLSAPALVEYRLGYPDLDRSVRVHKWRSRMTKDYRVEVLFATVDAPQLPALEGMVRVTEEAERAGLHAVAQERREAERLQKAGEARGVGRHARGPSRP